MPTSSPPSSHSRPPLGPAHQRGLARLTAFATGLAIVLLTLLHVGPALPLRADGSGPGLGSWSTWSDRLSHVGPPTVLIGLVRVVALVLAGYLLVIVTVELVGRATGHARLLTIGRRASTPLTRRLVAHVAGVGLAAGFSVVALVPASPVSAAVRPPVSVPHSSAQPVVPEPTTPPSRADEPAPVMRSSDAEMSDSTDASSPVMHALGAAPSGPPAASTSTSVTIAPDAASPPHGADRGSSDPTSGPPVDSPVLRSLDGGAAGRPGPGSPAPTPTAPAPGDPSSAGPAVGVSGPTGAPQWVIERGDHLWGVARRTLAGTWSRPPTDAEVARYLAALVATNADVFVVPGDADLVYAGQVFALPPVPAA